MLSVVLTTSTNSTSSIFRWLMSIAAIEKFSLEINPPIKGMPTMDSAPTTNATPATG